MRTTARLAVAALALMGAFAASGATVKTATQPWVAKQITNALDGIDAKIANAAPADYAAVSNAAMGAAQSADLAKVATSGDYADLANKPAIPTVPTKVSAFANDAGYLTEHQSLSGYATTNALAAAVADNVKSVNKKTGAVTLNAADVGAATEADVNSVWGYMKGETFRVVVTNYDSAVNPPRTRYDYRMGTNEAWRTVWTETNGLAWAVSEATNLAAGAAQTMLDKPANRAWGGWDSHTGLPAPDGVVQVSGGGGLLIGSESGWTQINATGGSYWVLTSTDPTLRANGTNGVFAITDPDGKSVMTIRKGDKRLVYADAAGIAKSGDTITVKYDVISDTAPTAEVALALDGTWYEQGASGAPFAVSWSGSSGAWVMTATAPSGGTFPGTGFFRAMFETGGDTEVVYDAAIGLTKVSIGGKQYTVGTATVTDASGNTRTVFTLE